MKKDKLDIKASIIDSYYNEISEKDTNPTFNNESNEIRNKLNAMSDKFDCINELDFDLDVNILNIIQNAEDIKAKKKNKFETLYFLLIAFLILSSLLFIGIASGFKVLIYGEIFIGALMPFALIPLAQIYKKREEV